MTADPSVAEHAARLAERAGEVALCLDFDGTLSPIVDDPQAARPAVVAAHEDLKIHPAVQASGAWLEDKEYAVAVHTRRVADPDRWAAPIDQATREIADRHGLEVVPGKLVWELRPAVRSDKGDAVRRVVAESAAREVVVVGDDLGDLAAFAAVAGLAAEGRDGLRVAVRSAEAPPALLAEADLVVDGPPGVLDFLHWST
jgi:trehalose 6-phosphate phosphatase